MDRFNSEQVRKIWQRVQSGPAYTQRAEPINQPEPDLGIQELIIPAWQGKIMFLQLSRRFSGKKAAMLRQMANAAQSHSAILRGICTITGQKPPKTLNMQPSSAPTAVLLQRCYGHCLRNLSAYESRCKDPQYGGTFQKMAEQEAAHCRTLLALLGSLQ